MERERKVLNVAIKLGTDFAQHPVADLGESNGLPIGRDGAQARDRNHGARGQGQQRESVEMLEPRKERKSIACAAPQHPVKDEL